MNLVGKTAREIDEWQTGRPRRELVDAIKDLVTRKRLLTPTEIAARSRMSRPVVVNDMKDGLFGGEYFRRTDNQLRVSEYGYDVWINSFRIPVNSNGH